MSNVNKEFDFEKNLQLLEATVLEMEKNPLSIESALLKFEEGIHLIRQCQTALKEAEQKVQILMEKNNETSLLPYPDEENE